ncbi:hypothetical protein [Methylobacterium organophilum]|uniref:Uncharacterized protein n=1 Tax=Methylobacterium organophilum TaxID=410 RepID=A0ABQ4TGN5_METOR|nr:hypothetical protein [Methylobacterium organophilum]GJE29305.1 hypothetical protein LKMONMHP_4185 [Methylobacterium organophilum]
MRSLVRPALAAALVLGATLGAQAGERILYRAYGYGPAGYGDGYTFAEPFVSGSYVGAPLTRFPRPSEIVPPAWGYGTYGVPTYSGIRQGPAAKPMLYVIDSPRGAPSRAGTGRARIVERGHDGRWSDTERGAETRGGGARVVDVTVPRR